MYQCSHYPDAKKTCNLRLARVGPTWLLDHVHQVASYVVDSECMRGRPSSHRRRLNVRG